MAKAKDDVQVSVSLNGETSVETTLEAIKEVGKKVKVVQIPDELLDSKEYKKLVKQMGEENCREFFQKSEEDLRALIAECEVQKKEAKNQTKANDSYRQAAGVLKDFNGALRDAMKPLNEKVSAATAIIAVRNEAKKAK